MKMIEFTNASAPYEGTKILINVDHIVSVYEDLTKEKKVALPRYSMRARAVHMPSKFGRAPRRRRRRRRWPTRLEDGRLQHLKSEPWTRSVEILERFRLHHRYNVLLRERQAPLAQRRRAQAVRRLQQRAHVRHVHQRAHLRPHQRRQLGQPEPSRQLQDRHARVLGQHAPGRVQEAEHLEKGVGVGVRDGDERDGGGGSGHGVGGGGGSRVGAASFVRGGGGGGGGGRRRPFFEVAAEHPVEELAAHAQDVAAGVDLAAAHLEDDVADVRVVEPGLHLAGQGGEVLGRRWRCRGGRGKGDFADGSGACDEETVAGRIEHQT